MYKDKRTNIYIYKKKKQNIGARIGQYAISIIPRTKCFL